ncbi:MAG: hypothetical protein RLY93_00940 [Sumerlaeia bacterium]
MPSTPAPSGFTLLDILTFLACLGAMLGVGWFFGRRVKDSADLFNAGGQSPWWAAGLSGYMTMFSAGTFVVYGGIAYEHGLVSVSINVAFGIAAIVVGLFIAGRWQKLRLTTVSEFVEARFSRGTVWFYTLFQGLFGTFALGGALAAFSAILSPLIPLGEGHALANEAGNLNPMLITTVLALIIIVYTFIGGLWAVLMTDVLQFLILTAVVVLVVPLALMRIGSVGEFIDQAPTDFFALSGGEGFTAVALFLWVALHVFKIGGDWPFAQRYICVPSAKDARKAALLFGGLFLVTPILWMLPPMAFRILQPGEAPREAYILVCRAVLPAGMIGVLMAAMFSATASMLSSVLNVYAGVLARDMYGKVIERRPAAEVLSSRRGLWGLAQKAIWGLHGLYLSLFRLNDREKELVTTGRILTIVLGLLLLAGGIVTERVGILKFILTVVSLVTAPLTVPIVWGLLSRRIPAWSVYACAAANLLVSGWLLIGQVELSQLMKLVIGLGLPVAILGILEVTYARKTSTGWTRLAQRQAEVDERAAAEAQAAAQEDTPAVSINRLPARVLTWTCGLLAVIVAGVGLVHGEKVGVSLAFAAMMALIAGGAWLLTFRAPGAAANG